MFEGEGEVGGKWVEERCVRVDPMVREYIHCQEGGTCL